MNTQTHVLVNMALLRKPADRDAPPSRLLAVFLGSVVPDLPMFIFFLASVFAGESQRRIWEELYFLPGWQIFFDIFNSVPLFVLLLAAGYFLKRRNATLFATGALLHVVGDFFLHHDDAHAHFFPITDWRFVSPVSYWDPAHFGRIFVILEVLAGLAATVFLFRRFRGRLSRALLVIGNLLNLAGAAGTYLFFGG